MAKIFVPVIMNDKSELFELSVTERNDPRTKNYKLILNNEPHPRYVDVITSKYTDLSHNVNLINPSMEFDVFTNATYSARLGIYLALQQKINNRIFLKNWDALVITGNLNKENNNLEEISEIEKKYEAVLRYAKEFSNNCLFVYVSNKEIKLEENPNIEIVRFSTSQTIKMLEAELFEPIFDEEQQRTLNQIYEIDQTHPYFPPQEFYELIKEALETNWKGCCICGDSNSGKSVFAFNLCKYFMSINKIYKPLWIALENTEFVLYKHKNENPLFLYFAKYFGAEEFSFEKVKNFLLENNYILIIDTKNLVFDSTLNSMLMEFFKIIEKKVPIIVTAIKQTDDLENSYLKQYSISNLDKTYCEKIFEFALEEMNINVSKDDENYDLLKELIYSNCCNTPGNVYILARVLRIETIQSLVRRLEMHNVAEIESEYINKIVNDLPEEEKFMLWNLVWEYQSKDLFELKTAISLIEDKSLNSLLALREKKIENEKWCANLKERFELYDKFYDLGLIKLKIDTSCYITLDKNIFLHLLKDEKMFDQWMWYKNVVDCKELGIKPVPSKKTYLKVCAQYNCYSFIIYKRYSDFLMFVEKAIKLDCNYYFLRIFAFLMILYEWSEKYILEYFDFLKKRKFDITRLVSETLIDEKTLFDIFEEFTSKDFQIEVLDKCDLSENYVNIVKNKKLYKKRFKDDKKNNPIEKFFTKLVGKKLFAKGKEISPENEDEEKKKELLYKLEDKLDEL